MASFLHELIQYGHSIHFTPCSHCLVSSIVRIVIVSIVVVPRVCIVRVGLFGGSSILSNDCILDSILSHSSIVDAGYQLGPGTAPLDTAEIWMDGGDAATLGDVALGELAPTDKGHGKPHPIARATH